MTENARWDLFVFDWDGTIMDTAFLIARGIQEACRSGGYPIPSLETSRSVIGLGMEDTMRIVCPACPRSRWGEFNAAYRRWYIPREATITLFPRLEEMLRGMKAGGRRMAVATGKSRHGLDRVLARTGLGEIFEAAATADIFAPKPDPAMLLHLSEKTGTELSRMVMIGDTSHDIEMARAAGCDSVAVTYGAMNRHSLERFSPCFLADDVPSLARVLGVKDDLDAEILRRGQEAGGNTCPGHGFPP